MKISPVTVELVRTDGHDETRLVSITNLMHNSFIL